MGESVMRTATRSAPHRTGVLDGVQARGLEPNPWRDGCERVGLAFRLDLFKRLDGWPTKSLEQSSSCDMERMLGPPSAADRASHFSASRR
jgi:hypothetical protein